MGSDWPWWSVSNSAPKSLLSPLQSACRDAEAVAHVLETYCDFTLLESPLLEERATSAAIKKAILDLIEQGEGNDFLLFYFSGHGQPMDVEAGRNEIYLGTHDFAEKQVERDETLHLSLPWLRDKLYQQTEAGKVLLVLDCCYSGEVGRSGPDPYLEELQQRLSYYFGRPGAATGAPTGGLRQALTATGHNAPAQESRVHGRMTSFLLPALRGEVPEVLGQQKLLTLWRLVDYLKERYDQPPKPALSGDDAGQDCILAYFPSIPINKITVPSGPIDAERPASYLPFPRNPFFQPRPGEFEHLERLLFTSGTQQSTPLGLVGVTGMGGVGKTQLAVELAYRYQHHFPGGIFWMPATGQTLFDWQRTLSELAVKTSFLPPRDDPANPEHEALRARHLCRYFASQADVLVILDNVEVPHLVTTALVDLAGGALACTVLYTSRQRTPLAGATLYPVEVLSEEGALRLLLESTHPALLAEVLAGGTSAEAEAAHQICRATGALPLALTILQSLLTRDRKLSLHTLANTLQERGTLNLPSAGSQQATLEETFQFSWKQVSDERARSFFLLASCFPEATPIPLWLVGLAAGLGERNQPFDPLWEISLSLLELSLLEGLVDDTIHLHPLIRAFGLRKLYQAGKSGKTMRTEAVQCLITAFENLALLEQRAQRIGYRACLEQIRVAHDYALFLDDRLADRLSRLERRLGRESYLLADEHWWPKTIPALFYQQLFNRGMEKGEPQTPICWIKLVEAVGADEHALLRIFEGHTDYVHSVMFSPIGNLVLTGSRDGTARLWDSQSGQLHAILKGDTSVIHSVAFSPNGSLVFTCSVDRTARLWNSQSGQLHAVLKGDNDYVHGAVFSPNSQLVLVSSFDNTARLWNSQSGQLHTILEGHTGSIPRVAFSPDSSLALTLSDDGTARLWNSQSGQLHAILVDGDTDSISSVVFSPDGSLVLTGSDDGTARLWDCQRGLLRTTLKGHINRILAVGFSPDGRLALTSSRDNRACLWDVQHGQLHAVLAGHTSAIWHIAFSPDGSLVLTGSDDCTARLWDSQSGQLYATLARHNKSISSVAFSPDGRFVLTGSYDWTALLWDTQLGQLHSSLTGSICSVAFSPNSSPVLTGSFDGTARLWDAQISQLPATLKGHTGSITSVAFSPDGNLMLTGSDDNTACLWDARIIQLRITLRGHTESISCVAFSPDGRLLITGSHDQTVRLWDAQSGVQLATLARHTSQITSIAFSPDGSLILTGSLDSLVRLWDSQSGQLHSSLVGQTGTITCVAFSPDGSLILAGSYANTACLWNTQSGRLLATLAGHIDDVSSVAFSPDNRLVLTGSKDHTARLWDAQFGQMYATLAGHTGTIIRVAFSPDGRLALTCDDQCRNFFWRIVEPRRELLAGLFITSFPVEAIFWQDLSHLWLADTGGQRGLPYLYHLSLEGPGWWS